MIKCPPYIARVTAYHLSYCIDDDSYISVTVEMLVDIKVTLVRLTVKRVDKPYLL